MDVSLGRHPKVGYSAIVQCPNPIKVPQLDSILLHNEISHTLTQSIYPINEPSFIVRIEPQNIYFSHALFQKSHTQLKHANFATAIFPLYCSIIDESGDPYSGELKYIMVCYCATIQAFVKKVQYIWALNSYLLVISYLNTLGTKNSLQSQG